MHVRAPLIRSISAYLCPNINFDLVEFSESVHVVQSGSVVQSTLYTPQSSWSHTRSETSLGSCLWPGFTISMHVLSTWYPKQTSQFPPPPLMCMLCNYDHHIAKFYCNLEFALMGRRSQFSSILYNSVPILIPFPCAIPILVSISADLIFFTGFISFFKFKTYKYQKYV